MLGPRLGLLSRVECRSTGKLSTVRLNHYSDRTIDRTAWRVQPYEPDVQCSGFFLRTRCKKMLANSSRLSRKGSWITLHRRKSFDHDQHS